MGPTGGEDQLLWKLEKVNTTSGRTILQDEKVLWTM